MFLPKSPKIFCSVRELDEVETSLDIRALVDRGVSLADKEVYEYRGGEVRLRLPEHHDILPHPASASVAG